MTWMPGRLVAAQPAAAPPLPPMPSTPVDGFRQMLAAKPADREVLLAAKRPEVRRVLENSLHTYDALPGDEREARLRALELRFRIVALVRMAPSNRTEALKLVPEAHRALIEERLQIYDQLSPEGQRVLLEKERSDRVISGQISNQTSNQLRQIELLILKWQTVPPADRVRIQRDIVRVFEVSTRLSPEEREKMRQSLERFKNLGPAQREQCFLNFTKFADFSPAERRQFLMDVQEWEQLKPEDRATWRKLVSRMPPLPPRRPPPLPTFPSLKKATLADTNGRRD